jgi:hypothetical protein
MEMIKSRNQSFHTYNLEIANEIAQNIISVYYQLFVIFEQRMASLVERA